ncbi:MAG: caspase family protein [bacterium]|nr:caspase family protein [bacterium]
MKLKLLFLIIIACFISSGIYAINDTRGIKIIAVDKTSGEKKELKLYNKSYAVIIGIDQYENLPYDMQLAYAVKDAKGVEDAIRKNFKFDKIITLYNKDATKENITKILLGNLSQVTEEDAIFVFWAGHGYTEKTAEGDLGYLIPFDGTFKKEELYKNFSMTMIRDDISKRIPAKHIFYIVDACYGGILVTKRGANRETARDFNYLKEISKERVRQVLTAGDKDQQVLDGGPKGHSVFTGRFIELLENTDDFITATEISTALKEKVFSDANARNHIQTPKYGELYGLGDYVFIPSIERKLEDNQAEVVNLQKELDRLKLLEESALKANDESAKYQAEIEKIKIEAKLRAEQLKQDALEENRKKREDEEKERLKKENELIQKKKEEETRLAMLKQEVEGKRKSLEGATLRSISPEATINEMEEIDAQLKDIQKNYRKELTNGINQICIRINEKFGKILNSNKDEFESEIEFKNRLSIEILKEKENLDKEQTPEFEALSSKIESEYYKQITPFIERLKQLSENEFVLTYNDLILELRQYNSEFNFYPVTIRIKQPIKGIQVTCKQNILIPREEAKVLKQHFENNLLRAEIKVNFPTTKDFSINEAYVIDDALNKKYEFSSRFMDLTGSKLINKYALFPSKFIDLGNGVIYDNVTKLLWLKDANYLKNKVIWENAELACNNLNYEKYFGWRLPTYKELIRMKTVYNKQEQHPFVNLVPESQGYWINIDGRIVDFSNGQELRLFNDNYFYSVWPVRGSEYK